MDKFENKTITIYRENRIDQREEWDVDVTADIFWRSDFANPKAVRMDDRVAAFIDAIGVLENGEHFDRLIDAVLEQRPEFRETI